MELLFLIIGIGAGLDYGLMRSWGLPSWERTLTKTTSIVAITLWAMLIDTPDTVILGLSIAAIADFSDSRGRLNWLAFRVILTVAFHAIYVSEYIALIDRPLVEAGPAILLAGVVSLAAMMACWHALAERWLVGFLFTATAFLQFSFGQMIGGDMVIFSYTTCLFFVSGVLMGLDVLLLDIGVTFRNLVKPLIWLSYFAAQVLTIVGFSQYSVF